MKIGRALLKNGLISSEKLEIALKEQEKTKERLGDIVIKMGFVDIREMAPFLAKHFGLTFFDLRNFYKEIKPEAIKAVPEEFARRFTLMPVDLGENTLTIAMFDPLDVIALDTIKLKTGLNINRTVSSQNDIIEAHDYCYHQMPRMKEYIKDFIELESPQFEENNPEKLLVDASDPPVVQYANSLIVQAASSQASDIHIRPKQDKVNLSFRIDGILYDIDPPPKSMLSAIITRLKILSNLDISEHRFPQDGRFKIKVGLSEIDIRISTFPTIYGESVVMRLLDTSSSLLSLEKLGFSEVDLKRYQNIITHSYGLILVTGPTGSGKTTTLYATLNSIKSHARNMVTLEDPVEYRLPFAQQSQVNPAIGFDFAKGLRSILRQDPDVIMVGEIRDKETAEIAIHAALIGHLVFSTLHTNDAAGAVIRLINMGVEPFLIVSSLLGVLAQRLLRRVCPSCKEKIPANPAALKNLLTNGNANTVINEVFRGKGCKKCLQSGFKGRSAVNELLVINEDIRGLIFSRPSNLAIKKKAQEAGMKTIRENGVLKLKDGFTTAEEVLRVTQEAEEP